MKDEIVKICKKHGELRSHEVKNEKQNQGKHNLYRCIYCLKEKRDRWRENNREKHRKGTAEWKKKTRDEYNRKVREYRKKNPEVFRRREKKYKEKNKVYLRKKEICRIHELTIDKYEEMRKLQDDKCFLCGRNEQTKGKNGEVMPLCVDHCHKSEERGNYKIRKLLCRMCNQGIGFFKDDTELMQKAIQYIKDHQ